MILLQLSSTKCVVWGCIAIFEFWSFETKNLSSPNQNTLTHIFGYLMKKCLVKYSDDVFK